MADPTCQNCPAEKRVERYSTPKHDSSTGAVVGVVHIARCVECGNQLVDDAPAESPNMPQEFEETVSGGQRVVRKGKTVGPPAGALRQ